MITYYIAYTDKIMPVKWTSWKWSVNCETDCSSSRNRIQRQYSRNATDSLNKSLACQRMTSRKRENNVSVIMQENHAFPQSQTKHYKRISDIWHYHGFIYKDCCLLISLCTFSQNFTLTFWKILFPPLSW